MAGALGAQPGMKQQTFVAQAPEQVSCLTPWDTQQSRIFLPEGTAPTVAGADGGGGRNPAGLLFTAGFCAGASPAAGSIGYHEEIAPTLKGSAGGNMMPSVLCLNDQGGGVMDCSMELTGTLRAQEHGHQPLIFDNHGQDARFQGPVGAAQTVSASFGMGGNNQPLVLGRPVLYENHGIDSRYTGPHPVAPTMSARYGTGGNNVPLIAQEQDGESICIAGSTISRDHGGGEGIGCQEEIAYTLTGSDQHAVFSRQRSDALKADTVAGTQSARQEKEATDLVLDVAGLDCRNGRENGDVCGTLQQGTTGSSLNSIHPVRAGRLIRRLTPLECERLQGYPDGWTDLEGASDSARYKALGNSVAIPCVDFVLRGIAYFLNQDREKE